jgi:tetratricopeptide (TPR) repeat protein
MSQGRNRPRRPNILKLLGRRINSITNANRRARRQTRQRFSSARNQLTGQLRAVTSSLPVQRASTPTTPATPPPAREAATIPIPVTDAVTEVIPASVALAEAPRPVSSGFRLPPEQEPYISFLTGLPVKDQEVRIDETSFGAGAADSGSPAPLPEDTVPVPSYDPNRRSRDTVFGRWRRGFAIRRPRFKIRNRRNFMVAGAFSLLALLLLILGLVYLSRFFQAAPPDKFVVYYAKLGQGTAYNSTSDGLNLSKNLADNFRLTSGVPGAEVRTSDDVIKEREDAKVSAEMKRTEADVAVWGYYNPDNKTLNLSLTLQPNGPFDIPDGMGYHENQRRLYDPGLLAFVTPIPPDNATASQPLTQLLSGLYSYYSGGYEEAVADFTNMVRISDPANLPAMRLLRGNSLFAYGKYKEAVDEYDKLLALINDTVQRKLPPPMEPAYVLNNRAIAVSYLPGKYEEAKANFETALSQEEALRQRTGLGLSRVRVNYVALQLDRPGVTFKVEDLNNDLRLLDEAAKMEPGLSSTYYYTGRIYNLLNNLDKAAENYKKAEDLDPTQPGIYRELGFVYIDEAREDLVEPTRQQFQQGLDLAQRQNQQSAEQSTKLLSQNQAELARVWQDRAKATENVQNDLKYGLARAYFEKGWREGNVIGNPLDKVVRWAQGKKTGLEEARDRLIDVLANRPNFGEAHLYLGQTLELLKEGDPNAEYAKAKDLEKGNRPVLLSFYNSLATFYVRQGRPNDAVNQYNEYLKAYPNSFEGHLNLARLYVNISQYDKGLAEAQRTIQLNPAVPEAFLLAGRARLGQKQPDDAINYFNQALNLRPDYPEALYYRGNAYFAKNKPNEASRDYAAALAKDNSNFPEAHYRMGLIYAEQGDPVKAKTEFEKSLQLQPNYAPAYFQLGQLYSRNNTTLDQAINAYTDTIKYDEGNASAFYLRGLLYETKNRIAEAQADYQQALQIEPGLVNARIHLARLLFQTGKLPDALKQAQYVTAQDRSNAEAWDIVGDIYQRSGDFPHARDAYTEAIKLRANYIDALYGRGAAYYKLRDFGPGLADVNKALSLDSKYPGLLVLQGQYLTELGRYDEAAKAFENARALNDKDATLHSSMGLLYLRRNQPDLAFSEFNQAIQLDPNLVEPHFWLGSLYNGRGDRQHAISEYERTVQLQPDWALAWRYLGEQYLAIGKTDEAIQKFNTAIQKDDRQIEAFYQRGNAYRAKGQRALAQADYDSALKLNDKYAPALLQKAITYEEVGDTANARKYYQLARTNATPSETQIRDEAQRSLTRLGP